MSDTHEEQIALIDIAIAMLKYYEQFYVPQSRDQSALLDAIAILETRKVEVRNAHA